MNHAEREQSRELNARVTARANLLWAEHCTECAWPACYTTCAFYRPRADLRCARFIDGLAPMRNPPSDAEWFTVRYGKWAKLEALGVPSPASSRLRAATKAADKGARMSSRLLPLSAGVLANKVSNTLAQATSSGATHPPGATHFALEAFNHDPAPCDLTITIRAKSDPSQYAEHRLTLPPGYSQQTVSLNQVPGFDASASYFWGITPSHENARPHVSFGLLDAVSFSAQETPADVLHAEFVKCVVWDLDNTLWRGTLTEDGAEALSLHPLAQQTLKALDERGIVSAVCSKNDDEPALSALKRLGVEEYFVARHISWGPKSEGLHGIAKALNIGVDSLAFIDDSAYERGEVQANAPHVRVYSDSEIASLLERPEFAVPVTADGMKRRMKYRENSMRVAAAEQSDSFEDFLQKLNMTITIDPLTDDRVERFYELTQRTNQMNFSGSRLTRDEIRDLAKARHMRPVLVSATDAFGDYGTIGIAVINTQTWHIIDLAFSCRIQSKTVEHHLLHHWATEADAAKYTLRVSYTPTPRNAPSAQVFDDLAFTLAEAQGVQCAVASTQTLIAFAPHMTLRDNTKSDASAPRETPTSDC